MFRKQETKKTDTQHIDQKKKHPEAENSNLKFLHKKN